MNDATRNPTPPEPDATDTTGAMLPVADAAAALGLTSDAIRARIRRGKMHGEKRGGQWFVSVPSESTPDTTPELDATKPDREESRRVTERDMREAVASADTTEPPANATTDATGPAVDMSPFVDLIDDLTRRNADLAAAAAMWQTRAAHLEDQLRQLGAGGEGADATDEVQGVGERAQVETYRAAAQTSAEGILARLRRWLAGDR